MFDDVDERKSISSLTTKYLKAVAVYFNNVIFIEYVKYI